MRTCHHGPLISNNQGIIEDVLPVKFLGLRDFSQSLRWAHSVRTLFTFVCLLAPPSPRTLYLSTSSGSVFAFSPSSSSITTSTITAAGEEKEKNSGTSLSRASQAERGSRHVVWRVRCAAALGGRCRRRGSDLRGAVQEDSLRQPCRRRRLLLVRRLCLHRGSADRSRPSVCLAPSRPQADVRAVHHDGAHLQGGCARVRGSPQAHQGGRAALIRRSAGTRPTAAAARLCLTDALPLPLHRLLSPPPLAAASAPPPSPPSPKPPWPAPLPRRPRTLPLLPCSLHSA